MGVELTRVVYPPHNYHDDKDELVNHDSDDQWLAQKVEMNPVLELLVTNPYEINAHKANEEREQPEYILDHETLLLAHDHAQPS